MKCMEGLHALDHERQMNRYDEYKLASTSCHIGIALVAFSLSSAVVPILMFKWFGLDVASISKHWLTNTTFALTRDTFRYDCLFF